MQGWQTSYLGPFQKELTALGKVTAIDLRINSPGGDVFDGFAIYNMLAQHPATCRATSASSSFRRSSASAGRSSN